MNVYQMMHIRVSIIVQPLMVLELPTHCDREQLFQLKLLLYPVFNLFVIRGDREPD